ncbi:hypothetical protein PgNI_10399 [Pyricularia grisea]|uniref:Uncharacterized protein n=1 Tax=Pyricularia grisea TaxID=148305 RepID=A0A6P8AXN1_PYRGI|nr:hypothetical protein PgNI_10399 [Pyricularia grisea]TLD07097.1 hypothetical protein PgNI_10399 [Pyricularia grisea]
MGIYICVCRLWLFASHQALFTNASEEPRIRACMCV